MDAKLIVPALSSDYKQNLSSSNIAFSTKHSQLVHELSRVCPYKKNQNEICSTDNLTSSIPSRSANVHWSKATYGAGLRIIKNAKSMNRV